MLTPFPEPVGRLTVAGLPCTDAPWAVRLSSGDLLRCGFVEESYEAASACLPLPVPIRPLRASSTSGTVRVHKYDVRRNRLAGKKQFKPVLSRGSARER